MKRIFFLLQTSLTLLGQAWLILGISLILLLLVDQSLRVALPSGDRLASFQPGSIAPGRSRAQAVADDPWIDAYWNEHEDSRYTRWISYVYWRRQPFYGALIHVDSHGFRVTPPFSAPLHSIWLFGGSTVWGTGNRNTGTLAAQLQAVYQERAPDLRVRVLNFGESGYVSRQSLGALQSALACDAPSADMAIFVDGANDVFAALQQGVAGLPQNEDNRRSEFNSSRQLAAQLRAWAMRLEGITQLLDLSPTTLVESAQLDRLAGAVADAFVAQVQQATALAQFYDFDLLYAWQPTVFDRSPARGDEAAIVGASIATHVQLQRRARELLRSRWASSANAAIDLGNVFDGDDKALFFDFVHLSERGQRLLAERLFDLSAGRLRNPSRPRAPSAPSALPSHSGKSAAVAECRDRPLGFSP